MPAAVVVPGIEHSRSALVDEDSLLTLVCYLCPILEQLKVKSICVCVNVALVWAPCAEVQRGQARVELHVIT